MPIRSLKMLNKGPGWQNIFLNAYIESKVLGVALASGNSELFVSPSVLYHCVVTFLFFPVTLFGHLWKWINQT